MKIVLICGSMASKSHTRALLFYLESLLKEKKIETAFWDLQSKPIPIVLPEYHHDPIENPDLTVKEFVRFVESADGVILGSPLYHGSYAGALKNALDNLSGEAFMNKPVGLVGNASSVRNPQALEHLRSVVRTMYGYASQTQIATAKKDYLEEDDKYVLADEGIKKRCQRMAEEIKKLTIAFSTF